MSFLYVGIWPAAANFSIRSGRIPSDANITTFATGRSPASILAPAEPVPRTTSATSVERPSTTGTSRRTTPLIDFASRLGVAFPDEQPIAQAQTRQRPKPL